MNILTDQQLLRAYAEVRSEAAFAELVRRHIDLIYSAALRMVCDAHLAEDVTQAAFIALAQKAHQLTERAVLSGWLHRTAQNIAAQTVRTDVRRRAREQEAAAMNKLLAGESHSVWEHISPYLDAALGSLSDADRDAVLLRYFERKSAQQMAQVLGVSEEAAQKRVGRALERLRDFFAERGVSSAQTGLGVVFTANAVQSAPIGLSAKISTAAVFAKTTIASTATATAGKAIAMTTVQKTLVAAVLAVSVGSGIYEALLASAARKQLNALKEREIALSEQSSRQHDDETRQLAKIAGAENDRLNRDSAELLKLRGEVAVLRREAAKIPSLQKELAERQKAETEQIPLGASKLIIANPYLAREAWSDKGLDTPKHAIETMLWAGITGNTQRLGEVTTPGSNFNLLQDRPPLMKIKGVQLVSVDLTAEGIAHIGAIVEDEFYGGGLAAPPGTVQNTRSWYLTQTNGEWRVSGGKGSW